MKDCTNCYLNKFPTCPAMSKPTEPCFAWCEDKYEWDLRLLACDKYERKMNNEKV